MHNAKPAHRVIFTTFTSQQPDTLTKILSLDDAGQIVKQSAANMAVGIAERTEAPGLEELAAALDRLTPAQAVGWGVCTKPHAIIVPERDTVNRPEAIARTRKNFQFRAGPGVMMLDHDGMPDGELSADAFRLRLIDACPKLANAPMLWRPSCSAGVLAPDGREMTALTRHRLYIPVRDASLIPQAGAELVKMLWLAGMGWYEVGRAGQALGRTLVDASVWQPERLDFCAPPVLLHGLQRPHAAPRIFGDPLALFDLREMQAPAEAGKRLQAAQDAQRRLVRVRCREQRERWASERAPALAELRRIPLEKARDVLGSASEKCRLMGDFMLTAESGESVSVGAILDNPKKWHGTQFADPLDPDDDCRVAVVNLKSGQRPSLYTHRHGGMRFELMGQCARILVATGRRGATTDAVLSVLQERGELYEYGEGDAGSVVCVRGGKTRSVSPDWLTDYLDRVAEFYTVKKRRKSDGDETNEERTVDAPPKVAQMILAKHGERGFKQLTAVVTAPTLRLDGTILDKPGHDAETGLLYYSEHPNPPRVPHAPSAQDALKALRFLWEPLSLFPLVDAIANAVTLHGLLSATLRASLPTAPGVGFDAPTAGSGKTLLARCIGILATGHEPAILPPADTEEETRKRLFTALLEGRRVVLWDNVHDLLGGAALDSFLTAPTFADRVLGASQTIHVPNRALFIATGNNLRMTSDTCRRVLTARIDAQSERPYARDFSFDPAQTMLTDRAAYVVAALTIVRAYITAGRPKMAAGRIASFEHWDDLVRQPICWLKELVAAAKAQGMGDGLPDLADPADAVERAFEQDPETAKLRAVLGSWHAAFGDEVLSVGDVVQRATGSHLGSAALPALLAALDEVAGQNGKINTRTLGRWMARREGTLAGNKRLARCHERGGVVLWRVQDMGGAKATAAPAVAVHCAPEAIDDDVAVF